MVHSGEGEFRIAHAMSSILKRAKHPGATQVVHQGTINVQQIQATAQFRNDMLIPNLVK